MTEKTNTKNIKELAFYEYSVTASYKETLENNYQGLMIIVKEKLDYYIRNTNIRRLLHRAIRILTIAFLILTFLCPFVFEAETKYRLILGFIFLSIYSSLLILDNVLNISKGYIRFFFAGFQISKEIELFSNTWTKRMVHFNQNGKEMNSQEFDQMIGLLKDFTIAIQNIIEAENIEWKSEYMSNLKSFDSKYRKDLPTSP